MRIAINLATRPFADLAPILKRLRIVMGALVLLAIALGLGLHLLHRKADEARQRARSLDSQIANVTHERQSFQTMVRQPENALVLQQVDNLNQLFDEKAFSWTLAMESLETVLPGGVQVTSIEPTRAKDGHITLRLRVVGPRDKAIELVQNLEHSRRFLLPRIVGESAEAAGGPGQRLMPVSASDRVNFDLLTEYNPPPPKTQKPDKAHATADQPSGPQPVSRGTRPGRFRPSYTGTNQRSTVHKPQAGVTR
jgi:type IV pilus assembly protein PilN